MQILYLEILMKYVIADFACTRERTWTYGPKGSGKRRQTIIFETSFCFHAF